MIRYRPNLNIIKYSLREERTFDSKDEMLLYIHDRWSRIVLFMGARHPFRMEEIIIKTEGRKNDLTGWKDEHEVLVKRMSENALKSPMCIGYCGE